MSQAAVCCGFFCAVSVLGQSLHISSASGSRGDTVVFELSSEAPSGQEATVLKWDMTFPAQLLEAAGSGPQASQAATDSGKALTCSLRQPYTYTCILAGGQKPIRKGPIAAFPFKIRADARTGPSTIRIDHVEAASKDLQSLPSRGGEGVVEIR